jgi:hypothetical protein
MRAGLGRASCGLPAFMNGALLRGRARRLACCGKLIRQCY